MTDPDQPAPPRAIAHTVLDYRFLAYEIARRYPLKGVVTAQMLYRGMNDVYIIADAEKRYALRVWRNVTHRPLEEDVAFELDFLDYLKSRDFPASGSVRAKDGSRYFVFEAPEGPRPIALYDWAPGEKFGECLDEAVAERIGGLFARMHLLGRDYPGTLPTRPFDVDSLITNIPHVEEFVFDRPEDLRDYPIIGRNLAARLMEIQSLDLPKGICHRDFHPSNVHVSRDGVITFLDFDACSEDYWIQDVKNYVWGNDFYSYPALYGDAFERGYRAVRPYTADEDRLGELFLLSKAYRLISGLSAAAPAVGRGVLRFRNLDWFAATIKPRARALGLL